MNLRTQRISWTRAGGAPLGFRTSPGWIFLPFFRFAREFGCMPFFPFFLFLDDDLSVLAIISDTFRVTLYYQVLTTIRQSQGINLFFAQ
jgi:hypothetical protein